MYAAFCMVIGAGFGGAEFACFVLLSEYVDCEYRNRYLGMMQAMWGLSIILISAMYWINSDWRFLSVLFLIIAIVVLVSTLFSDESVRFLTSVR